MNYLTDEIAKKIALSQPSARKSRSISRYFLGHKRSSVDNNTQENDIYRYLISVGIFDSYDLWTNVTLYRDYSTYRRLFIITNKNELIIGKSNHRHFLFKIKQRIDLNHIWSSTQISENIVSEITSLNYFDEQRSLILGWPLAENFLVEFDTTSIREIWRERIESTLHSWYQINHSNIEHVRIVIDQYSESDQNNNTPSFLIRKVISVRPEETVRDLIKKSIDAFHLRDPFVDNYILFATNDQSNGLTHANLNFNTQSSQITNSPLIGHEHPYSIKMKHVKNNNAVLASHRSFDGDDTLTYQNSSSTSLNSVVTTNYHDFELRKRDVFTDHQTKKYRFFHKRKTKQVTDGSYSSSTPYLSSPNQTKNYLNFFGRTLDELMLRYDHQLPPVIMQLLEILYVKGPETTGIFRKVANTRSVKDCIDKIERNIVLHDDDLHPILAAGIFKHFLRTLPEPLFTSLQYDNWKKCLRLSTLSEKISFSRKSILSTLSEANHILLKGFICILHRISEHAVTNGMNPFNLGLCVSNSLFKTESITITSGKQEADVMSSIVEFLIQNCSALFSSDILTCVPDKRIVIHPIASLTRPAASSVESLEEVESSPHLPQINRSHDSGLAASDPPFNDDSSEISEYIRRTTIPLPDWTSSIACGKGIVLTSIITNNSNPIVTTLVVPRRRSSKNTYKPSRQFLEREKLSNNTTDDSDNNSSIRSSATTIRNMNIGKIKRSKSLSRHSSLGSSERKQHEKQLTKESRHLSNSDVKRTSSLKQFHHSSGEGDDDDDDHEHKKKKQNLIRNERRSKPKKKNTDDADCITTRSTPSEQQDLDLTVESLSTINQRLLNSSLPNPPRSSSFSMSIPKASDPFVTSTSSDIHMNSYQEPIIGDHRSRYNSPLTSTTNKIYLLTQSNLRSDRLSQTNIITTQKSSLPTTGRIFVHRSDSRPFVLGEAIQMKPIDNLMNDKRRPCHRQNALRYKSIEQDRQSRISEPVIMNYNSPSISRYQSIERHRTPPPSQHFSSDNSVPTKFFEHTNPHKLSTGRENYV